MTPEEMAALLSAVKSRVFTHAYKSGQDFYRERMDAVNGYPYYFDNPFTDIRITHIPEGFGRTMTKRISEKAEPLRTPTVAVGYYLSAGWCVVHKVETINYEPVPTI